MRSDTHIGNVDNALDWAVIQRKGPHVARKIARAFPGIDAEDIQQEIYAYCLENEASILKTTTNDSGLEGIMLRAGQRYASKERYSYIQYSAEWIYTPDEVRGLLDEAFFDPIYWEAAPVKDDGVTITARGVVVCLWDISDAFDALSAEDQITIRSRYEFAVPCADATERKRLQRAIDKITQRLNGRMAAKSETKTVSAETV